MTAQERIALKHLINRAQRARYADEFVCGHCQEPLPEERAVYCSRTCWAAAANAIRWGGKQTAAERAEARRRSWRESKRRAYQPFRGYVWGHSGGEGVGGLE